MWLLDTPGIFVRNTFFLEMSNPVKCHIPFYSETTYLRNELSIIANSSQYSRLI